MSGKQTRKEPAWVSHVADEKSAARNAKPAAIGVNADRASLQNINSNGKSNASRRRFFAGSRRLPAWHAGDC
jgi:hypothetical protein